MSATLTWQALQALTHNYKVPTLKEILIPRVAIVNTGPIRELELLSLVDESQTYSTRPAHTTFSTTFIHDTLNMEWIEIVKKTQHNEHQYDQQNSSLATFVAKYQWHVSKKTKFYKNLNVHDQCLNNISKARKQQVYWS